MNSIILLILLLLFIYLGNVISGYIICETIETLKIAKRYIFIMPFIIVSYAFHILFFAEEENLKKLIFYIKLPSKMLLVTCVVAEIIKEKQREIIVKQSKNKVVMEHETISDIWNLFGRKIVCSQIS